MARPQRNNVDYFPHPVSHGRQMFIVEEKFGNDGYAFWFKLIEQLGKADFHYLDLRDETQIIYLESMARISRETLFGILDLLAKFKWLDAELWENRVVFSEPFVESISDAYLKRNNKCMNLPGLREHLSIKSNRKPATNGVSGPVNPQRKGKDRIGKERKEKNNYGEFVSMTQTEHDKLVAKYGAPFTVECIRVLDNYKGSSGKKYSNDYRAILSWVVDRVKTDGIKPGANAEPGKTFNVEKAE